MEFILKDKRFAIRSAELFASIPNPRWVRKYDPANDPRPFWSLEIWIEGDLGIEEEARATAEEMRFPIRRWTDVVGQTVEWGLRFNRKPVPYGNFYLGVHDRISRARLRFIERDGIRVRFEWEGVCNVYWDDDYRKDVPFSVEGWAHFNGVTVSGDVRDTAESMRERLAQYFEAHDFVQGPLRSRTDRLGLFRRITSSHVVFTPLEAPPPPST